MRESYKNGMKVNEKTQKCDELAVSWPSSNPSFLHIKKSLVLY